MSARPLPANDDAASRRYQSLLAVTESISSHAKITELFKELPAQLRPVVNFDAVAVVLHDEVTNTMRLHVFETTIPLHNEPSAGEGGPVEMSPEGLVWQTQEPMLISAVLNETRFPEYMARLKAEKINTLYSIPLTSSGRRLGAIAFGSVHENAYDASDLEFLRQVAKQVAVAIDNVLNLQSAAGERDRKQLLLDVGQAVVSNLSLGDLFRAVSSCLKRFINHDSASLVLLDQETNELRVHMLDNPPPGILAEGMVIPLDGSPAGLCIKTRATVLRDRIDFDEFYVPQMRMAYAAGLRCGCSVPLIAHDQVLGSINVGSFHEAAFTKYDAELLEQIAGPVAIAVENALNFQRAERERDRKQLLLDINNAVVTNLTLKGLLKAISDCLDKAFHHDAASISLYDPATGHFRMHVNELKYDSTLEGGVLFAIEGTPAGKVFQSRQTLRLPVIKAEEFPSPIIQHALADGLRSGCSIPLIVHDQFLGVLEVASRREDAFSEADAEVLTQVAGQIAIAVQNSLNFERANRERERAQILLEINNTITTNLDLHDLIRATSACLRNYFKHDLAGMSLLDDETNQLKVHSLDSAKPEKYLIEGDIVSIEGTLNGLAFKSRQPVVRNRLDARESSWPLARKFFEEQGLKSACFIPMIWGDRVVGVLNLSCRREDAFNEDDVALLVHLAGQIAIAVENSLNFERVRKVERQAARERDRTRLLLEINNAVVSHLDLKEVVKTISASLREIMPHDAAGIALYDPEQNLLREYTNVAYKNVEAFREGETIPIDGTPAGQVFVTGQPLLVRRPNPAEYPADRYSQHPVEGSPKSACLALLSSHGRKLGIAGVSSTQEERFTEEDLELFSQISGQIALAVENSLQYREIDALKNMLAGEKLYLEEEIKTQYNFAEIVGQSSALREVLRQVETVAPTDSTVLLIGETGTGKELIARAIHNLSARNERTLVKLNCAAIPTGLLESELFGHEKGAFTGAIAPRVGRFELAHKGTLLLDEIGEIPLELQPKLLRVLQEHEFERLGSSRTIKTDARLIAATNCDLAQMVEERKFRSDLFYRLNVFPIIIPPLRERAGDIPLLVSYFGQKHAARMNKKIQTIPAQTMEALRSYHWPGNVRELENFVERSVILSRGSELQSPLKELQASAEFSGDGQSSPSEARLTTMDEMERAYIEEVLRHTNGSIGGKGGAAEILGLPASTLRSRMKKLGIR